MAYASKTLLGTSGHTITVNEPGVPVATCTVLLAKYDDDGYKYIAVSCVSCGQDMSFYEVVSDDGQTFDSVTEMIVSYEHEELHLDAPDAIGHARNAHAFMYG